MEGGLTVSLSARVTSQKLESLCESVTEVGGRQHSGPRSGQLDGERKSIEGVDDLAECAERGIVISPCSTSAYGQRLQELDGFPGSIGAGEGG